MKKFLFLPLMQLIGSIQGVVSDLSQFGRVRKNAYACPTNNLKFDDGCECDDIASCKDTLTGTVTSADTVVAVRFGGVDYSVNKPIYNLGKFKLADVVGPISVEAVDELKEWLVAILKTREINRYITIECANNTLTVCHIGGMTLESITLGSGTVISGTRCCDIELVYEYAFSVNGDPGALTFEGNSTTLANQPYDYVGTAAIDELEAATLATDFAAALTAVGFQMASAPTVTVNNTTGAFDIRFYSAESEAPVLGGITAQVCSKENDFVCGFVPEPVVDSTPSK